VLNDLLFFLAFMAVWFFAGYLVALVAFLLFCVLPVFGFWLI